jgi:hypothetical protein
MRATRAFALATLSLLSLAWVSAQAGGFVGVGVPGPFYHPYRRCYGPRVYVGVAPVVVGAPVVVTPVAAPVVVAPAPAPVVVQQPPQVIQVPATPVPPPPAAQPGLPPALVPVGN